jgi:hypothetical protein
MLGGTTNHFEYLRHSKRFNWEETLVNMDSNLELNDKASAFAAP